MIAYIKGKVTEMTGENLVLEVNGIGYNIKISPGTAGLLPGWGQEVKMYTYTHVREDAFLLYGFLGREELEIFKKLITVGGIGPKGGLSILSVMTANELRFAIASGDAKAIAKAPGIGVKTAERIILDLRDKISSLDGLLGGVTDKESEVIHSHGAAGDEVSVEQEAKREAAEALMALGYPSSESWKAVRQVVFQERMDTEEVLKQALKYML
ncbi:MAG: Holliday junction branch migration protein RuvA [Lachnospiraceae bacterium]|nr:Holliday junction branch migration protein RuvA [Lachnospiraceae bacterium]